MKKPKIGDEVFCVNIQEQFGATIHYSLCGGIIDDHLATSGFFTVQVGSRDSDIRYKKSRVFLDRNDAIDKLIFELKKFKK